MNQFHIYEPIGRGKHSVVYKGRKKSSVEYVAIKSTGRAQKNKVLQEVKVMHAVKHPNVLRFHAWYETTNHLWLILEYCVGGDLQSLLKADKQLPEGTVLRFARDVAVALQYLHSSGTLHCDLNPSNLLLDENGRVKLGGFSLARRPGDAQTAITANQVTPSMPFYAAPELLQGTEPPSTASDLWSLGCILYECTSGRLPFVAASLSSLTTLVTTTAPAPLIGTSPEFQDLVSRLLDRDPATRLAWAELCTHPFWGASPLEELALPAGMEPAPHAPQVAPKGQYSSEDQQGGKIQTVVEATEADVSPPRLQVRHLSSAEGTAEVDHLVVPDAGPTPLHPSSRQRAPDHLLGDPRPPAHQLHQQPGLLPTLHLHQLYCWPLGISLHIKSPIVLAGGPCLVSDDRPCMGAGAEGGGPPDSLESLIWHPTDATMKPIVGNKRIERPLESAYALSLLPFKPLSLQRVLSGSAHQHTKLALLCYLETLSLDSMAAHDIINSDLCVLMVHMLHNSSNAELRSRLANTLGLLIRHTSVVQDSLAQAGMLEVLAGGLEDSDLEVQRRCTAALGELLFYVASQQRDARAPGAAAAAAPSWQVPVQVLDMMVGTLAGGRDEVVQHYAVKTIENIAGQGGVWGQSFASADVVAALSQVVGDAGSDAFRGTAASALCRLLRCKPALLPLLLDQPGMGFIAKGMADSSPRVQQAATTMLCLLCSNPGLAQRALKAAETEKALMASLGGILEHPVDIVRAKGLVAVALLCRGGPGLVGDMCSSGAVQRAERMGREQSQYISSAMAALRLEMAAVIPSLLAQIASSLRALQQCSASTARTLPQMPTLLYLLGSPTFRDVIVSSALVASLADILTRAISSSAAWVGCQDIKDDVLQAIDSVCSHPELLLQHYQPVLSQLLPALSAAVASSKESSDTRFVCLKLLCAIVLQSVTEPTLYYPSDDATEDTELGSASDLINQAVGQYVLPLTPALFADEDPMPLYALKMLAYLLDVNPAWVQPLAELGIVRRFFEWLSIDHPHNNVHNIRLCRLVAQTDVLSADQLCELEVVDRVLAVLSYAHEAGVEPFLEPSLQLCIVLLGTFSRQPTGGMETGKLIPALPLLMELCLHSDAAVAAAAAACLAGVTQLHTDDAAAVLAAENGFALLSAVLQPEEGGINEAAAFHLMHVVALAAQQPPFLRRRDALQELGAAVRRAAHTTTSTSLKQAAAEAVTVLGQTVGQAAYAS